MNTKLTPDLITDPVLAGAFNGIDGRRVADDPGLALLRRYLPVLGVIAAPYVSMDGDDDPLSPLDPIGEWRALVEAFAAAANLQEGNGAPLALVRLLPPTGAHLRQALQAGGADAFRVVHLICHGDRDMLYLEDDEGREALAVPEHVANLFRDSGVWLVVLDGCYSPRIAQVLLEETGVKAVVGTRRKVSPTNILTFMARFYADLAGGVAVRPAFRAALSLLRNKPDGQVDRFEMLDAGGNYDEGEAVVLPLPEPDLFAVRPLLDSGQPRCVGVPYPSGFVGRRELLARLVRDIPAANKRALAIHGPAGVGKSWLVADFVSRFCWRFPDGVLWFEANAQTTAREIVAQLAGLFEMPSNSPPEAVLRAVRERRVLLVLDDADALVSRSERERLGALLRWFEPESGSRVVITARKLPAAVIALGAEAIVHPLGELSPRAARTLALRLAVERGLDVLDVDTIDDFLERALNLPWLIARGIELVESNGLPHALEELGAFRPDMPDPLRLYVGRQIKLIEAEAQHPPNLLVWAQGLPDSFDVGMSGVLSGGKDSQIIQTLIARCLIRHDGALFSIPREVRAFVRQFYPLPENEQDQVDEYTLRYLARSWPSVQAAGRPAMSVTQKTRLERATVNNLRRILRRQLRSGGNPKPVVLAGALVTAAPTFCALGLADEFLLYTQPVRKGLPEGETLARLQIAMGEALALVPDRTNEAGWLFQTTPTLANLSHEVLAEANRAYARHLVRVGEAEAAAALLADALRKLLLAKSKDVALAAGLAHDWAGALIAAGQREAAVKRFEGALAGYAEAERPDLSAEAQVDFAELLADMGELDRAEDTLRRALATVEERNLVALQERVQHRLARLLADRSDTARRSGDAPHVQAEAADAERLLLEALERALPAASSDELAGLYHDLARVQARLSQLDDAAANAGRGRLLFARAGQTAECAAACVTLGRVWMAQGDSVAAQAALHDALDLAGLVGDEAVQRHAAGVLVRVHQIRARHAPQGDQNYRKNALDQASFSRAALARLGLDEHIVALDAVITHLSSA